MYNDIHQSRGYQPLLWYDISLTHWDYFPELLHVRQRAHCHMKEMFGTAGEHNQQSSMHLDKCCNYQPEA